MGLWITYNIHLFENTKKLSSSSDCFEPKSAIDNLRSSNKRRKKKEITLKKREFKSVCKNTMPCHLLAGISHYQVMIIPQILCHLIFLLAINWLMFSRNHWVVLHNTACISSYHPQVQIVRHQGKCIFQSLR